MKTNLIKSTFDVTGSMLSKTLLILFSFGTLMSCDTDDNFEPEEVVPAVANFEFSVDEENTLLVHFSSSSVYAESYIWNFGDGNTSTDEGEKQMPTENANSSRLVTKV